VRCEADCFSGEDGFCCEAGGSWAALYVQVVPLPPGLVCGRVLVLSIHFDRRPPSSPRAWILWPQVWPGSVNLDRWYMWRCLLVNRVGDN